MINKKLFSQKLFPDLENLALQEVRDKLEQLQKAKAEISEKIKNHKHPDEIPKLKAVLMKFEEAIAELQKIISIQMSGTADPAGMQYIKLPGGKFEMGSAKIKNNPPHEVTLSPFEMAETLVTQRQWRELMGEEIKPPYQKGSFQKLKDDYPMMVNWLYAVHYCQTLSLNAPDIDREVKKNIEGFIEPVYLLYTMQNPHLKLYRLPTEAEWEYAAKAGQNYEFGTEDGKAPRDETSVWSMPFINPIANVREALPNKFGLYDMAGHLKQWMADIYSENFFKKDGTYHNPFCSQFKDSPDPKAKRVVRASAGVDVRIENFRSAARGSEDPDTNERFTGFRPVRNTE